MKAWASEYQFYLKTGAFVCKRFEEPVRTYFSPCTQTEEMCIGMAFFALFTQKLTSRKPDISCPLSGKPDN
jgi:hypothetical protein